MSQAPHIEVKVELVGTEKWDRETKALMRIYPATDNAEDVGNYDVCLSKWGHPTQAFRSGQVRGFNRMRGFWFLLRDALNAVLTEE